jgi:3-deoxy-D-arabino-heptulosonate 7-phosphate (DAHP) synthase
MRISLWKPRTKPGFDGLGNKGIPLLVEATKRGINPATEVLLPSHAKAVMKAVLPVLKRGKLLLWIGSRNQNHLVQKQIAKIASSDLRVMLLVKNQPWADEKHWEGIIEHVLSGGISMNRLILCHRGFIPNSHNPLGLRNIPDYEMSERIKLKMNLPMVFDPSHTGGSVPNVLNLGKEASKYNFNGLIVEVHPDPKNALTDANQQLTWEQFDRMVKAYEKN